MLCNDFINVDWVHLGNQQFLPSPQAPFNRFDVSLPSIVSSLGIIMNLFRCTQQISRNKFCFSRGRLPLCRKMRRKRCRGINGWNERLCKYSRIHSNLFHEESLSRENKSFSCLLIFLRFYVFVPNLKSQFKSAACRTSQIIVLPAFLCWMRLFNLLAFLFCRLTVLNNHRARLFC